MVYIKLYPDDRGYIFFSSTYSIVTQANQILGHKENTGNAQKVEISQKQYCKKTLEFTNKNKEKKGSCGNFKTAYQITPE